MEDHRPSPRFESIAAYNAADECESRDGMFKVNGDGYDFRQQIWNDVSCSGEVLLWESAAKAHYDQAIARSVACRLAGLDGERDLWIARANRFAKEFGFERIGNGDCTKEPEFGHYTTW